MRLKTILIASALFVSTTISSKNLIPYLDETIDIERRVEDALQRMTLEEKIAIIHANSKFSSPGCPRLGIPEIWAADGTQGVREDVMWDKWDNAGHTNDSCTAYPALMSVAATWNRDMAYLYGKSIGEEFRYRKKDIALTPGINIYRHPLCGRNFEYMGEDPLLAGVMATEAVKGIQSNGVAACVKHFALNNQEKDRHKINVDVSDRALQEIYLPAFKKVVKEGKVWAVMGSYNKYKGEFCCHNSHLNKILKDDWGFDGVLLSDWGGTEDTEQAIHNGLDLEFGTYTDGLASGLSNAYDNYYLASPYLEMIKKGGIGTNELDNKAKRVLRLCFRTNMNHNRPYGSFNSPEHAEDSRRIQEEGIVLLKNDKDILPINPENYNKILVVGENANFMLTKWGGSSNVKVRHETMPIDAIRKMVGNKTTIEYQKGYTSDWPPVPSLQDSLRNEAMIAAKSSDLIIFIGGHNKYPAHDNEGTDRTGSAAPFRQDELLDELVKFNKPIVLVTMGANQFDMPWNDKIPAMIHAWYGGSESGTALANVLFGKINPSGKLPVTFYKKLSDCGAIALGEYPGDGNNVKYNEDIFVGYRYIDKEKITPAFPFGHGLSYTRFSYGKPTLSSKTLTVNDTLFLEIPITNVGMIPGKETVQLYIQDNKSSLPRPVKELKGFDKLHLAPGETKGANFTITNEDLKFFDDNKGKWISEPGTFTLHIGASSKDIRQLVQIRLTDTQKPASNTNQQKSIPKLPHTTSAIITITM